jgi:hypothetical protein
MGTPQGTVSSSAYSRDRFLLLDDGGSTPSARCHAQSPAVHVHRHPPLIETLTLLQPCRLLRPRQRKARRLPPQCSYLASSARNRGCERSAYPFGRKNSRNGGPNPLYSLLRIKNDYVKLAPVMRPLVVDAVRGEHASWLEPAWNAEEEPRAGLRNRRRCGLRHARWPACPARRPVLVCIRAQGLRFDTPTREARYRPSTHSPNPIAPAGRGPGGPYRRYVMSVLSSIVPRAGEAVPGLLAPPEKPQ